MAKPAECAVTYADLMQVPLHLIAETLYGRFRCVQ